MKITQKDLKRMILEILKEQEEEVPTEEPAAAPEMTSREKKVATAAQSGGLMSAEEYGNTLKQVLLTQKVSTTDRKAALEAIFGQRGSAINSLLIQLTKQQGAQE